MRIDCLLHKWVERGTQRAASGGLWGRSRLRPYTIAGVEREMQQQAASGGLWGGSLLRLAAFGDAASCVPTPYIKRVIEGFFVMTKT